MPSRRRYSGPARRRALGRLIFLALALGAAAAADQAGLFGRGGDDIARYDNQQARVVHHVDGDTFDVGIPDTRQGRPTTRLRLWGVDTPETVRPDAPVDYFGPEASAFTKELTQGQSVRLHVLARRARDKYGRLLAYVDLPDGQMLNRLLLEKGYAYADPRFSHPHRREFATLMRQARREQRGLWANAQESQLPPYLRPRLGP